MENYKNKILFLVSGNGGNLVFINLISNYYNFEIVGVLSDRFCKAIEYASNNNIFTKTFMFDRSETDDIQIIETINFLKPDIIVTNIHKILSKNVCESFRGFLINLHYSILPAFKGYIGMVPVKKALELNCSFVGSTCHLVDEFVDNGKIISQALIMVEQKTDGQLVNETFKSGALVLLTSILLITKPGLKNKRIQYADITIAPCHDELFNKNVSFDIIFDKVFTLTNG